MTTLLSNSTLFHISISILVLILFIFLIKKYMKNPIKLIKYLYFIFFLIIYKVLSLNITRLNSPKILGIFYIILSFSFIKFIDILINESYYKKKKNLEIPHLIRNIVVVLAFTISFLSILKNFFNVNLTSLLTTSAILSAVIGLAVQDTLTTFIAGLVLTSDHSFELGDTVIIKDIVGKIIDTNWRTTKLLKAGGGIVSIPNNLLLKEITVNYLKRSNIVITIKVSASYNDSPNKVKNLLLKVAHNNVNVVKDPEPFVIISGYGDSGINYELKATIHEEYLRRILIETELYSSIWYAFNREGIKIPYSVREIVTPKDLLASSPEILSSYFQKVEFFNTLKEEDLNKLQQITKLQTFGRNEFIFMQNDPGDSFFIIKTGKVCIMLDDKEIACLHEGDFFGEMSLLTGNPRTASVKASEDTEVLVIEKDAFKGLIQTNQELLENVLEFLTKREEEQLKIRKEKDAGRIKNQNSSEMKKTILKKLVKFFEI